MDTDTDTAADTDTAVGTRSDRGRDSVGPRSGLGRTAVSGGATMSRPCQAPTGTAEPMPSPCCQECFIYIFCV